MRPAQVVPVGHEEKREILKNLKQVLLDRTFPDMKAWAKKLHADHQAGKRLTAYQIECYQSALKIHA